MGRAIVSGSTEQLYPAATYASLLRWCRKVNAFRDGQLIHCYIVRSGLECDVGLNSLLIEVYAHSGAVEDAHALFHNVHQQNVFTWNFLFKAYAQQGQCRWALQLFDQMQQEGVRPNKVTFLSVLEACSSQADLDEVEQIHAHIIDNGFESDVVVGTALLNMYGECSSLKNAWTTFNKISVLDVVAWTSMMSVFVHLGQGKEAVQLFHKMKEEGVEPNRVTLVTVLSACDSSAALPEGKWMHSHILTMGFDTDVVVGTALLSMYGKCGSLEEARRMFLKMIIRNVVSWNAIIALYTQHGQYKEALRFFEQMMIEGVECNKETYISILNACTSHEAMAEGEQMHVRTIGCGLESDVIVGNALVKMYGKCGSTEHARRMFDRMPDRNVVSWTAIVSIYAWHGQFQELLRMFDQMQLEGVLPNKITFGSILAACTSQAMLAEGMWAHAFIFEKGFDSDIAIGNALVNMYGKCGSMEDAWKIFDEMCERDVITWTAMIGAYAQHGHGREALQLYGQMHQERVRPTKITLVSILCACAIQAALEEGKQVHGCILQSSLESDLCIGNALVNMYGKCGSLEDACGMFEKMTERDSVSWNTLIMVYAQHGQGKEALKLFYEMLQELGVSDKVTCMGVLAACSHAGLIEDACQFFMSIDQDHRILPSVDHYVCMIDLLGRAGCLDEADVLIHVMPMQPNVTSFLVLLYACQRHVEVEGGERAAKYSLELDPKYSAPYVALSNIYASVGRVDDANSLKSLMQGQCLEDTDSVDGFFGHDWLHSPEELLADL